MGSVDSPIVVFDLDGTLALIDHRRHLLDGTNEGWRAFYAACPDDAPNMAVILMYHALRQLRYEMWIVSGRSDEVREQTLAWLDRWELKPHGLLMRSAKNHEPDVKLKRKWLQAGTIPRERVMWVFDDRASVVAMWREEGLTCFQVAPGDF
jgi:hypothetical protein